MEADDFKVKHFQINLPIQFLKVTNLTLASWLEYNYFYLYFFSKKSFSSFILTGAMKIFNVLFRTCCSTENIFSKYLLAIWMGFKLFTKETGRTSHHLSNYFTVLQLQLHAFVILWHAFILHFTCQYSVSSWQALFTTWNPTPDDASTGQMAARETHSSHKTCNHSLYQIKMWKFDEERETKLQFSQMNSS